MRCPYLKQQGTTKVLMVHDKPFVMLAGELHNSNSSTPEAMEASCQKAVELGMNSVIATLSWELIEPEEDCFDFSTVDMVVETARKHGLKLELIWFGSWKNAQCAYAPAWVKRDLERFPRAEMRKGKRSGRMEILGAVNYSTLSYLGEETRAADAKAFRAVMAHIREIDSEENTVLMMQVENETGVLTAAREHSARADELFYGPAPAALVQYLKAHTENMAADVKAEVEKGAETGTWEECFGAVAEEIFSAYCVSSYVNAVASAGKAAYDIPMSANCWLEQGKAGDYPSGGPVARVMEVWQFSAPAIDVLAPDIYIPAFCAVCEEYTKNGNPLFIPEIATHAYAGVRQLYAVGRHHAVCYAPFGFEDIGRPFLGMSGVGMDLTDPALSTRQDAAEYREITAALRSMLHKIAPKLGTNDLQAVSSEQGREQKLVLGDFGFTVKMGADGTAREQAPGGALVLKESEDTFWLLCVNCVPTPFSNVQQKPYWDYLDVEEGYFEADGRWHATLRRNGDEIAVMRFGAPMILRVKLFAYGD